MKNKRIRLEKIDIPEIKEDDLLETISKSKVILKQLDVRKKESHIWGIIKKVIFIYGWKSILLQGLLALFVLMSGWMIIPETARYYCIALLWMGGLIMSIAITAELVRSDIYQMTELERTCQFSPQRLLLWKMGLLSIISVVGLFFSALVLANKTEISFYTLLWGGCIPFFLLTGLVLQLHRHENILSNFVLLYLGAIGVMVTLEINYTTQVLYFFDTFGVLAFIVSFGYCMTALIHGRKWRYSQ